MSDLGLVLFLVGCIGTVWFLIKKNPRNRNISLALIVVGFVMIGVFAPESDTSAKQAATEGTTRKAETMAELEKKIKEQEEKEEKERKEQEEKEEQERKEQEEKEKELKEEEERAQKAKEEEERAQRLLEVEQAKKDPANYETGITYENLARTPDEYKFQKVKLYGRIVQVMESDKEFVQYRLAVNDDYNNVAYLEISNDQLSTRILKDDYITVYGESYGTISYDSTMGGKITIPAVVVNMFEFN